MMKFLCSHFSVLTFILHVIVFSSHVQSYNISRKIKQNVNNIASKSIIVDQSGNGDFKTVQEAVDSAPSDAQDWTHILIKNGIYNEKLKIPKNKKRIVMEGEDASNTIIQFGDNGNALESATFTVDADYFIALKITFKNTYNGKRITWAPAALLNGDKAAFRDCVFIGVQDTLTDSVGRHYFENCEIEGDMDFIWGGGQSVYNKCTLKLAGKTKPGYITAQSRGNSNDPSGFVFISCNIQGSGDAYLGRAHGKNSRVLFYDTFMSEAINPKGWYAWNNDESPIVFAEEKSKGPGANKKMRVKWEKPFTDDEIAPLKSPKTFIDEDDWVATLPIPFSVPNKI